MAKSIVPTEFKTHVIDQVIESVTEPANTIYYAFIGDHLSEGSTEEEVTQPIQTIRSINTDTYRNMIIGKRLSSNDIKFMVNRYDWEANTVFEMYDDVKADLFDSKFYTVVDETAYKHVYKCLYNADGRPSTVKPLFRDAQYDAGLFTAGDDYYETSDGYQWKYLYSIDSVTFNKFATQKYIPVTANTTIENNASPGSIDVIRVESGGKNYRNTKRGQFAQEDFNRITSTVIDNFPGTVGMTNPSLWYRLTDDPVQVLDFYTNTIMYLTSGTGAGQFVQIIESRYITGIGVVVKVAEQFEVLPDDSTTYEIAPEVRIIGNGNETVKATARAIINADASYSVSRIEMLDRGSNYTYAEARVLTGKAADIDGGSSGPLLEPIAASVRPIISPQGGHGANTAIELGASRLGVYMKFNRGENGLISPENTFGQFGLLRDPKFANVELYFETSTGSFIEGETIKQINTQQVSGSWQANTDLGVYIIRTDSTGNYGNYYEVGDDIYIQMVNSSDRFLTKVATGSNTTAIALEDEIPWLEPGSDYDILVYDTKILADGVISNINPPVATPGANAILVNRASPSFKLDYVIYGETSRNVATITGIDINSRIDSATASFGFADFNQLLKIQGTTVDTFYNNEQVSQESSTIPGLFATGYIHSWDSENLYLTSVSGDFESGTNQPIIGGTSGAVFTNVPGDTIDITYGDLDPNEGAIIYVQNDIPVSRDSNQSEQIRVILEF